MGGPKIVRGEVKVGGRSKSRILLIGHLEVFSPFQGSLCVTEYGGGGGGGEESSLVCQSFMSIVFIVNQRGFGVTTGFNVKIIVLLNRLEKYFIQFETKSQRIRFLDGFRRGGWYVSESFSTNDARRFRPTLWESSNLGRPCFLVRATNEQKRWSDIFVREPTGRSCIAATRRPSRLSGE